MGGLQRHLHGHPARLGGGGPAAVGDLDPQLQAAKRAFLIQDLLVGSVEELGESGQDHRYGFGRIDVLRAIGFARDRGF